MSDPISTTHADLRARKRIGISDPTTAFTEALDYGLHQRDLKGQFRRFIDTSARKHRCSAVIYRGMVFWYAPKNKVLITIIPLHQKWHKYIKPANREAAP